MNHGEAPAPPPPLAHPADMPPLYRELLSTLEDGLEILPDKPDETPAATLNCLWMLAAGQPMAISQATGAAIGALDGPQQEKVRALIKERLNGTPLAYLVGRQDFMGLVLTINRAALVPRVETEILGYAALAHLNQSPTPNSEAPKVIDLCTGCGNLALALAVHAPHARVWGSDLSEDAVALARVNAEVIGRPDVTFVSGDLAEPFDTEDFLGEIDVLTCNPPYISSAKVTALRQETLGHEPRLAFDGGPFGISIIQRLTQAAPRLLKPGGWLLFEVGLGQGEALRSRLARNPAFDTVESHSDARGDVRVLAARRRQTD